MGVIIESLIIIFSSVVIYYAGKGFASSSSKLGDYFKLPRDVKGATFDAISGSLPELMVALYSVLIFHKFEIGVGTIAGSALFNILVIPALCVLLTPISFKISKNMLKRDSFFYILSLLSLIFFLIYFKEWGIGIAFFFIGVYFIYLVKIGHQTKKHRQKSFIKSQKINFFKESFLFFLFLLLIGFFTFFLTNSAINLSNDLNISPIIIAFTIIAAATSFPDMVISVVNARKGNFDDAITNIFGSNIFDIFIGLGLPLLIYSLYSGFIAINFSTFEIVFGLLFSTIVLIYFLSNDLILTKGEARFLLFLYFVFVVYVLILSGS